MSIYDHVALKEECGKRISDALKELIETRHLYQYVLVELRKAVDEMLPNTSEYGILRRRIFEAITGIWLATPPGHNPQLPPPGIRTSTVESLVFRAPRARLYCNGCKRLELHDCSSTYSNATSFFLVYNCLSCGKRRVTFLVEREHLTVTERLRLAGRNPIEHTPAPPSIPLFLGQYYSDAVIAFACGFTRMGVFGLRTVIEQWARVVTGVVAKIEGTELFEKYSDLLPSGFSSLYPSLGALYSDLSADMHSAAGDTALFERAEQEIGRHFSGLRSLTDLDPSITRSLARKES